MRALLGLWRLHRLMLSFLFGLMANAVISGGRIVEGLSEDYYGDGAPVDGTDEVQTLTKSGTLSGGTFRLGFEGFFTATIAYNATAAAIVAALEALPNIGTGGVTGTGGTIDGTPVVLTFAGNKGRRAVSLLTLYANSLTGSSPTITIAETTAGVDMSPLLAAAGAEYRDTTNGVEYLNTGTALAPTWQRVAPVASGEVAPHIAKVALAALDTGGGILAWQNPEGVAIIVERVILDVTTPATAACTGDFGTTATSAATSSDNLIDGVDLHTAAGQFDNLGDAGTNGKARQKIAAGKWLTGSMASGAAAGLAGYAYVHYYRA